jgi:hypothetical protein
MGSRGVATLVLLILGCVVSGVLCSVEDGLPRPENFPDEPTTTYGPTPQLTGSNGLPSDCQWYGWANSLYDAASGTTCLDILRKALTNATVNPPSSLEPFKYYTIKRLIDPATNQSYCYEGCFILTQSPAQSPLGDSLPPFASPPEPLTDAPSPLGDSLAPTPLGDGLPPAPLGDALPPSPLGDGLAPTPLGDGLAPTPLGDGLPPAPLGDSLAPAPGVDTPMGAPPPVMLTPAGSPPATVPVPAPADDTYPVNEPLPSPPASLLTPPPMNAPPPPSRSLSPPAPPVTVVFNGATSVAPSAFVSWLLVGGAVLLNFAGR